MARSQRVYDLSKAEDWNDYLCLLKSDLDEDRDQANAILDHSSIKDFIKTGKSRLKYEKAVVLTSEDSDCTVFVKDDMFYVFDDSNYPGYSAKIGVNPHRFIESNNYDNLNSYTGIAAVFCEGKSNILVNGDEEGELRPHSDVSCITCNIGETEPPTISFNCLGQFYKGNTLATIKRIIKGEIVVLEFKADSFIKSHSRKIQPESGYTYIENRQGWHRSGTVLLHDKKNNLYILLGQDEGTYFGVELPEPAKTIKAAYDILTPDEVKGKAFHRQGEWFVIPVKDSEVPELSESVLLFDTDSQVFLPIEDELSNKHIICTVDGRVGKNGQVYADHPDLRHEQHKAIVVKGWCTFYKNTAVRSHSQEGVD